MCRLWNISFACLALIVFCSVSAPQEFRSGFNNYSVSFDGILAAREETRIVVGSRSLIGESVVLHGDDIAL